MNKYMVLKEFKESLYESKGLWMIGASALILSSLCIIVVNIKEGSVLAKSDILQYALKIELFLNLIITMILGATSFASEREENTLESLLLTPISPKNLMLAKYMGILMIGAIIYAVSLPYLAAISAGSGLFFKTLVITLTCGLMLEFAFIAIAVMLSIYMRGSKSSMLISMLVLIVIGTPGMVQGLLKQSAVGVWLMQMNPVSGYFNMMKVMLTEGKPLSSQLLYLFPVAIFMVICIVLLYGAGNKIVLKGEK